MQFEKLQKKNIIVATHKFQNTKEDPDQPEKMIPKKPRPYLLSDSNLEKIKSFKVLTQILIPN